MRTIRLTHLLLLLCILIAGEAPHNAIATAPIHIAQNPPHSITNVRPLKVHMNTRTLWSDGQYTPTEMAAAARAAGYDAIFFADNALDFQGPATLADPDFEKVGPSGNFTDWSATTLGPMNSIAYAGPFALLPRPGPDANFSELDAYNYSRVHVRSGNYSLHLELQSMSRYYKTYGYAIATPLFPNGYNFSQPTNPTLPLLASDVTFSAYALFENFLNPRNRTPSPDPGDDSWFFLRFTLVTRGRGGPYSGKHLTITLVWSAQPVDAYLINTLQRSVLNDTNSKVIYFNPPQMGTWLPLNANVTDLTLRLWNESIVDQWRLSRLEIGVKSSWDALVSVYVDDAQLSSSSSWSPLDYLRYTISTNLSNATFKAYSAYSIDPPGSPWLPSMNVYNTTYFDPNQNYNLTDSAVWKTLSARISSYSGVVALAFSEPGLRDYIAANHAFGVRLIDGTTYEGLFVAENLLVVGQGVIFIATPEAISTADYNSTNTWSMMVYANSNSESDILRAISEGQSYLAVSNFTGTFSFGLYNYPVTSNLPIYVPINENITLPIDFSRATGHTGSGIVRVYQDDRLDAKIPYIQNASIDFSDFLRTPESHFFVTVSDPVNDSLLIVSNPITYKQANIIPDGALFIDNSQWTLQSSQWFSLATQQSFHLSLDGPAGTEANVYLYSPTFAPNAKDPTQLARWISVADQRLDPASLYNTTTSTFIIHVKSTGQPVNIIINFDIPFNTYLGVIFSSVVTLYLITILPFAIAIILIRLPRRTRRKLNKISALGKLDRGILSASGNQGRLLNSITP